MKINNKIFYIGITSLIIACGLLYLYLCIKQPLLLPKCPEGYAEDDTGTNEYRNALIDWTTAFFESNPNATSPDWSQAKSNFWQEDNCTAAIQRSKLSGKVADLKPWEKVDYEVQTTLEKINN